MKLIACGLGLIAALVVTADSGAHTEPRLEGATQAVLNAFASHDIVMLGETHGSKQEYDWLRSLVATPDFADRVDDIVMEFGNSSYQEAVDRYVRGDEIPLDKVQGAWRDTVASVGPPSPVYASLYQAVRDVNTKRKRRRPIRMLCGDPSIDWSLIREAKDIVPYLRNRERSYVQVVKAQVLSKHRRALLIMGVGHFLRHFDLMTSRKDFDIETQLRTAGANPYLIVAGTDTTGVGNVVDSRFASWRAPVVVALSNTWVGELPAIPVVMGGRGPSQPGLKLKDAADALLYLGPHEGLVTVETPRSEIEGTPYAKEIERRITLQMTLER